MSSMPSLLLATLNKIGHSIIILVNDLIGTFKPISELVTHPTSHKHHLPEHQLTPPEGSKRGVTLFPILSFLGRDNRLWIKVMGCLQQIVRRRHTQLCMMAMVIESNGFRDPLYPVTSPGRQVSKQF
jgi:hypothetical protein